MDLEARSLPVSVKTPLLTKLRDYKVRAVGGAALSTLALTFPFPSQTNLANLKASVKKAGAALMDLEGSRDELLSRAELGDTAGGAATSNAQRDRLLTAHDQLRKTGDRISEGKKQLLETEELGASILVNLKGQREQIINTRETLHGADDNIGRSRRILTSMARRAMQNKIILGVRAPQRCIVPPSFLRLSAPAPQVIIFVLLICIIIVVYVKSK